MMAAFRSEIRKLLTVRSTYFFILATLGLSIFLSFWVFGYKDVNTVGKNPVALLSAFHSTVSITGVFLSLVTVLQVGHEYRYNTIMYTLTAANRRTKAFLAKLLAQLLFVTVIGAIIMALTPVFVHLGWHAHHLVGLPQHLVMSTLLWHSTAYILGSVIFAYTVAVLFRNLIASFVFMLIVPSTIEPLLGLLLKGNVKYLPFTAIGNLTEDGSKVSDTFSLGVVAAYVVVGLLIAYVLYLRRDAN